MLTFASRLRRTRLVLPLLPAFALPQAPAAAASCVPQIAGDADRDGIPDVVEHGLLSRFRPYFKFSRDNGDNETFRPADIDIYLRASEIDGSGDEGGQVIMANGWAQSSPNVLLSLTRPDLTKNCNGTPSEDNCAADLTRNRGRTQYHINPNNDARRGVEWSVARATRNTGLYGHVVPLHVDNAGAYDPHHVPSCEDASKPFFYKLEYWQFFGYSSNNKIGDLYDHEADWDTLQLIVSQDRRALIGPQIVSVLFYAHGKQMRFDMQQATNAPPVITDCGQVHEIHGTNFGKSVKSLDDAGFSDPDRDNQILQLYRDPDTGEFIHPVVYVEHGGHEFWPSKNWRFYGAQEHNGDDTEDSYLTATPPNLGEVENPLTETPDAPVILRFNGFWGTYSREGHGPAFPSNSPPPGPPLHSEWTWPMDSSIRWQLPSVEN